MWLFHIFLNKATSAVLSARLSTERIYKKQSQSASGNTKYLATYPQIVNFLLKEYAIDEAIVESESEITRMA